MSRLDSSPNVSSTFDSKSLESSRQTQLLVSVRDALEAQVTLDGGVDWIDLKEPSRGALGAVASAIAEEVVNLVGNRAPVSAAAGELLDWPDSPAQELLNITGVDLLKLGLAGCSEIPHWQKLWLNAAAQLAAAGKGLVAVCYADYVAARAPSPSEVLGLAGEFSGSTLLIDTFDKSLGPLSSHLSTKVLAQILSEAKSHNMRTVVAGKLRFADVTQLPLELIDLIAVRGAVCRGERSGPLDAGKVSKFVRLIRTRNGKFS
ncbi:(5-formylfuran-3-yl)methyl phosphate synthase [Adhaeretor mobilis]|uniref:(5-formylfuran-3-yl)methyl phosphate synthase n=1 Tax=Adhaeretor mobilis TaxID=1930276 RepID=A0A517MY77_9BACT|nr:(5-formylfuran-3-yl)methyl phosphate synthase [Adhaeretor mobilis]QDS99777.1 hypothetical protein HG15A2_31080 [Adhaeretor mobilis]